MVSASRSQGRSHPRTRRLVLAVVAGQRRSNSPLSNSPYQRLHGQARIPYVLPIRIFVVIQVFHSIVRRGRPIPGYEYKQIMRPDEEHKEYGLDESSPRACNPQGDKKRPLTLGHGSLRLSLIVTRLRVKVCEDERTNSPTSYSLTQGAGSQCVLARGNPEYTTRQYELDEFATKLKAALRLPCRSVVNEHQGGAPIVERARDAEDVRKKRNLERMAAVRSLMNGEYEPM